MGQATAETVMGRGHAIRAAAARTRGDARASRLRAIELRYATGRIYRDIFGPVYAMADVASNGENFTASVVSAHRLLGSSAVVSMGIGTLLNLWDRLPADEREWLLHRMAAHSAQVDDGLRRITRGIELDGASDYDGDPGLTQAGRAEHLVTGDLVHLAIELGLNGADADEGAVELVAISGRRRKCLEMAVTRCGYLSPGDDVDSAVGFLRDALLVGDRHGHWLSDAPHPYLSVADDQ